MRGGEEGRKGSGAVGWWGEAMGSQPGNREWGSREAGAGGGGARGGGGGRGRRGGGGAGGGPPAGEPGGGQPGRRSRWGGDGDFCAVASDRPFHL